MTAKDQFTLRAFFQYSGGTTSSRLTACNEWKNKMLWIKGKNRREQIYSN